MFASERRLQASTPRACDARLSDVSANGVPSRLIWEKLEARLSQREACKTMVGLLELASRDGIEAVLAMRLEAMLAHGELPDLAVLRENLRLDKPIA